MNTLTPSLDADRHYNPLFDAAEGAARKEAKDVAAARPVKAALALIHEGDTNPETAAHVLAIVRTWIGDSNFKHFPRVSDALDLLDDAIDTLGAV